MSMCNINCTHVYIDKNYSYFRKYVYFNLSHLLHIVGVYL